MKGKSLNDEERLRTDLASLLGFYLACIEEEDKRSLQVSADQKFGRYIIPSGEPGALFKGEAETAWEPKDQDLRFIQRYSFDLQKQRFIYGFPLELDNWSNFSPLFFTEAEITLSDDKKKIEVHLPHPGNIQVNLHLFNRTHPMLLERLDLQDFLEGPDFGTIEARISAALEKLGESNTDISSIATPKDRAGWKNASILIRDSGAGFTAQLRRELADLKERVPQVARTAVAPLLRHPGNPATAASQLLEIAPLNPSQRKAIDSALTQPLTVVTGPPGTGKSQVVVAMLASMGAEGLPVLFASKNNQAVDVVRQRLAALLKDADWYLRLGNMINIDEEMNSKIDKAAVVTTANTKLRSADAEVLRDAVSRRDSLESEIEDRANLLDKYIVVAKKDRIVLSTLPEDWLEGVLAGRPLEWLSPELVKEILRRRPEIQALASEDWPGLWLWLKKFLLGKRLLQGHQEFLIERVDSGGDFPGWNAVEALSWASLDKDFETLNALRRYRDVSRDKSRIWNKLSEARSAKELKEELREATAELQKISEEIVRSKILGRLASQSSRLPTLLKEYWELTKKAAKLSQKAAVNVQADFGRSAKKLLEVVPGVVVTSLSARRSLPLEPGLFECIIVDEASQCDIASAIPLILRAKRLVVIGDPKQLRHISSIAESTEQKIAAEQQATALLGKYSYRTKSLYDCAAEALEAQGGTPFFLEEHYRSHPEIIEFSNRIYYQRRLVVRTELDADVEQAIFWHDVPAKMDGARGSLVNTKEADAVRDLVKKIITAASFGSNWTIGVVTPYRKQRDRIEMALFGDPEVKKLGDRLTVGTVHTFQGAESDVMVFSPVVASGVSPRAAEWISKEEGLLNVALTRARKALHIVGDKLFCQETPGPLGELAKFASQRAGVAHVPRTGNPAIEAVRENLQELGLWFQEEVPETTTARTYYLDFLVVGLSGARYDIEIDGKQHFFSAEAIAEDDSRDAVLSKSGYKVVRLRATEVSKDSEDTKKLLANLM